MTKRTDYCGRIGVADIGRQVTVCGWVARRRGHGEHLAFIDVRDRTGIVQCVIDNTHDIRSEYVIAVTGVVRARPEGTVNSNLTTGEIEIGTAALTVLSVAETPPFAVDSRTEVDEMLRIQYRYLDLRNTQMQENLKLRARVNTALRISAEAHEFIEIETPMLVASTPEGARDFLVPSRMRPSTFYALPQSPQLFKQLCMVGGIDRYYQIARCLRDEGLRSDRQFEFSQFDLEMSFADEYDVRTVVDEIVAAAITEALNSKAPSPAQMTWSEAMNRYGTDKPDLRFGMELVDLTDVFTDTKFQAFQSPVVKGLKVSGGASATRKTLDEQTKQCRLWGAKGLVWMRVLDAAADQPEGSRSVNDRLSVSSPVAKFLTDEEIVSTVHRLDAQAGDMCYLVADSWRCANEVLGFLRLELGQPPASADDLRLLWVTEFPLFEDIAEDGTPVPAHHPFTMPHSDDLGIVSDAAAATTAGQPIDAEALLSVRSQAYDLVMNGWELGSGSVRIHRSDIQQQIFSLLGINSVAAQEQFGFLLDAFRYGAPPHAGFAFGIDRLVALLCGAESIRDVIAFPKSQSGADPLTGAPTSVDARQLDELGIAIADVAAL